MRKSNSAKVKELGVAQRKMVFDVLRKEYANAVTALHFGSPMEMLVATILSAQCTDERVNKVTPALFERYRSISDFAESDLKELEEMVRPTGFFRNKAKNIKAAAVALMTEFGGVMPKTIGEMTKLPGVGRKTASVVLYNVYGVIEGVVVDTHVGRLSRRLGLSEEKDPEKVERDLMKKVPKKDWANLSYWLIDHGRAVCKSVKPDCRRCVLNGLCPSAFDFDEKGRWKGVK